MPQHQDDSPDTAQGNQEESNREELLRKKQCLFSVQQLLPAGYFLA
jgi:hypothetical protein